MRIPIYPLYLNIELILSDDGRTLIEASGLASSYIGRVIIPDGIESICKGAFKGCINLTEIHLPTSVMDIEQETFDECVSLTSIEVSKDNMHYMSEDGILYNRKRLSLVRKPIANTKSVFHLPDWVRSVDLGAFKKCKNLKGIIFQDGIESIEKSFFRECANLTEIHLPSSVVDIEQETFDNCVSLVSIEVSKENKRYMSEDGILYDRKRLSIVRMPMANAQLSVSFPDWVRRVDSGAFRKCKNLKEIILPDGIESILKDAFKGCFNLTEIHLPSSVVDIEQETFDDCVSLSSIEVSKENKRYMSEDGILYDMKRLSIVRMPMANAKSSVSLPDWVTKVDLGAFKECENIKEIIFSPTLTEIDDYAFCKCYSLVSMRMSDDVNSANGLAIGNEIHIPHGVKRIGASAFFDCRSISKIHLPSTLEEFGERVFEDCNNLKQLTIPMGCREIPNSMFSWCRSLKEVNIPNSVVRIGSWAFVGCRHLIGVDIPSVVTEIGYGAFRDCLHLRYFRLPDGLTEIKGETFNSCIKKKRIIIPEGVRKVGDSAIRLCESLEFLSLPSTLEEISFGGFGQCHKLRQIRCYSKKPDDISMSKSAFLDMDLSLCTLQVPIGMEQIYRNHFVFGLFGVIEAVL